MQPLHPMPLTIRASQFAADGCSFVPQVLSASTCHAIAARLAALANGSAGTRCLLSQPWCHALATELHSNPELAVLIPDNYVAVQCTYFEKSADRNWLVAMHQDLSIPVAQRVDAPTLTGWSEKEGALYVRAPVQLAQTLVAVRLHIDACGEDDGPLKVLAGTHLHGPISPDSIAEIRQAATETICSAQPGDAWVMRPHLLYSSSKSKGSNKRRVLHFLFGPRELHNGLRWANAA
jgi:hypothetical protein